MKTLIVNRMREPHEVYIGRGTIWGNPYSVEEFGRVKCIQLYREYIQHAIDTQPENILPELQKLKGKVLGCWCKPKMCHGDVLIEFIETYCK